MMEPRLVHVALKVDELDKNSEFYEKVFGFYRTGLSRKGDSNTHTSLHMSDGTFDLALMQYDSEDAPEAQLAGRGPCIHHLGIKVEDPLAYVETLEKWGCEILSAPGEIPVKFRDPGGVVAEVARFTNYIKPKA